MTCKPSTQMDKCHYSKHSPTWTRRIFLDKDRQPMKQRRVRMWGTPRIVKTRTSEGWTNLNMGYRIYSVSSTLLSNRRQGDIGMRTICQSLGQGTWVWMISLLARQGRFNLIGRVKLGNRPRYLKSLINWKMKSGEMILNSRCLIDNEAHRI